MDLSSIAQIATGISSLGSQAGGVGSQSVPVTRQTDTPAAASKALKRATDRTGEKLESTKVQLSAFGQIKGALSELQTASKAVSEPKNTATAADARKTVENFVAAFNKTNAATGNATLANDARARNAANDVRRSIGEGNGLAELKKAGIAQNKDGSLSIDTKALDKALKDAPEQTIAAVAKVGKQLDRMATRELASGGNVGASVETLGRRSRALEAEHSAQQAVVEASQSTVAQRTANIAQIASGIAAYQRNFLG